MYKYYVVEVCETPIFEDLSTTWLIKRWKVAEVHRAFWPIGML